MDSLTADTMRGLRLLHESRTTGTTSSSFTAHELGLLQQVVRSPQGRSLLEAGALDRHTLQDCLVALLPLSPVVTQQLAWRASQAIVEGVLAPDFTLRAGTTRTLTEDVGDVSQEDGMDTLGTYGLDQALPGTTGGHEGVGQQGSLGDHSDTATDGYLGEADDDEEDLDDMDEAQLRAYARSLRKETRALSRLARLSEMDASPFDDDDDDETPAFPVERRMASVRGLRMEADDEDSEEDEDEKQDYEKAEAIISLYRRRLENLDNLGGKKAKPFGSGDDDKDDKEKTESEENNTSEADDMPDWSKLDQVDASGQYGGGNGKIESAFSALMRGSRRIVEDDELSPELPGDGNTGEGALPVKAQTPGEGNQGSEPAMIPQEDGEVAQGKGQTESYFSPKLRARSSTIS